jgi:hypothetical protein
MALSFPLTFADFFDILRVASFSIRLGEASIVNRTGGGEIMRSDYGARLWQGSITLAAQPNASIEDVLAIIYSLQDSRASFLLYPRHKPRATGGGALSEPIGQINSLPANNRLITLKALPANYVITRGDFLSFIYSSSPSRYAFHQAVESITANGSGVTGEFEVVPPIRPGALVNHNVQFNKPRLKAIMVPGSLRQSGLTPEGAASATFDWQQTLR